MPSASTPCDSTITRVDLYARGAVITRRAHLPDTLNASSGLCITLCNLSPMAHLGSFRVSASGGGAVIGLDADLVLPTRAAPEQGVRAQVQALRRRLCALDAQAQPLKLRRAALSHPPDMGLRGRRPNTHPASRALDALAVSDLFSSLAADLDAQLADIAAAHALTRDALSSAESALQQASSAVESSKLIARPSLHIRFAPHPAPPTCLEVTYEVPAARWWPAYTLRLDSASRRARLSLEAFITQDTFEDWSDAKLSLITADLSAEVSLPELPSLRLGRPREPKPTGFRAPPQGLDLLFLGLDAIQPPPRRTPIPTPEPSPEVNDFQDQKIVSELITHSHTQAGVIHPQATMPMPMSAPKRGGGILSAIGGAAVAVVAAPIALTDALLRDRSPAKKSIAMARSSGRRAVPYDLDDREEAPSEYAKGDGFGGGPGGGSDSDGDAPLDLDVQWLNFDLLILARFDAGSVRGRLRPKPAAQEAPSVRAARDRLSRALPPPGACDPSDHRGSFDHRYDAVGHVEVPADGTPHRVHLLTADAPFDPRFVSVPAELDQVFRMVDITNPLSGPLLPGPADVFMDGALIITSPLPKTDRGGHFSLGLGVEDRITIARNVRTQEQRRGLLKGTNHIENTIHIEVTSALPTPCRVDVIDRLPTSTDPNITLTTLSADPQPTPYKQEDLGHPIEGGMRFSLTIPPGGRAEATITYAIEHPCKLDIIGGGHRE